MQVERIPVANLRPAEFNPRKISKAEMTKLRRSIKTFGYVEPIIVNVRDGAYRIVGGHQRLEALKAEGYDAVDCVVVDLHENDEKLLNVALNKISGEWDLPKLKDLLLDLDNGAIDLSLSGFDELELEQLLAGVAAPSEAKEDDFDVDEAVEQIKEPESRLGDVWLLGRHRLLCGDATSEADVARLVAGRGVQLVFTDPPYNVDYTGKTKDALKFQNDKMTTDQFRSFLLESFTRMLEVTEPGGGIYMCHADSEGYNFRWAMQEAGWLVKQCLVWVKNTMVLGRQDYQWKHEPILYGWKPGAAHRWYNDRKQTTVVEDVPGVSIRKLKDGEAQITFTVGLGSLVLKGKDIEVLGDLDDAGTTVWRVEKPSRSAEHPTMKPVALVGRALKNSSKRGDVILDLFGGSGSTLIAAEQMNRTCFTQELDPVYCDVIVKRWEKLTGQKARREA